MEEEAIEFYRQGNFASAREIFDKILQSRPIDERCRFNVAVCRAAEGDLVFGLGELLDLETYNNTDDFESIYDKALCLCRLDKPDLALALLDTLAKDTTSQVDEAGDGDQFVRLMMECMSGLCRRSTLTRNQCELMERLLLDYKTQIIKLVGQRQWTQNMGHVLFLTDTRFDECLHWYETLLSEDNKDNNGDAEGYDYLLQVDSDVLSNLCVSYILTGRNRDAEELIKDIEVAERDRSDQLVSPTMFARNSPAPSSGQDPELSDEKLQHKQMSRSTRLNLAIGTLYCVKGNHEFGLMRIFKSLEPVEEKLSSETWRQASVCILSTLDKHCRQMICIRDGLFDQIVLFLIQCEMHGIYLRVSSRPSTGECTSADSIGDKNSVTFQARQLRAIALTLIHD